MGATFLRLNNIFLYIILLMHGSIQICNFCEANILLDLLDLPNKEIRKARNDISKTALRATYTIWLARSDKMFGMWQLVERPVLPVAMQLEREGCCCCLIFLY